MADAELQKKYEKLEKRLKHSEDLSASLIHCITDLSDANRGAAAQYLTVRQRVKQLEDALVAVGATVPAPEAG